MGCCQRVPEGTWKQVVQLPGAPLLQVLLLVLVAAVQVWSVW
jgi:hypothetical protein